MITKFLRRRNPRTSNPFDKTSARIQVHANGSQTFAFRKIATGASAANIITTEAGFRLTTESSQLLIAD
jgi:hypothetical protein